MSNKLQEALHVQALSKTQLWDPRFETASKLERGTGVNKRSTKVAEQADSDKPQNQVTKLMWPWTCVKVDV